MNLDSIYNIEDFNYNTIKPFTMKLNINDISIKFQIDTGLAITARSFVDFHKYKLDENRLESTNISLRGYTGTVIIPVGIINVLVK